MKNTNPTKGYRPGTGVVLLNKAGLIFGAKRIDNPSDAWQMPQGGLDKGESPKEGALRELNEETGIDPARVTILAKSPKWLRYDLPAELAGKMWGGKYLGQEQLWFLMRFDGDDSEIDLEAHEAEFSEWRWMPHEELVEKIVPFKREMYKHIFAGFAEHLPGA